MTPIQMGFLALPLLPLRQVRCRLRLGGAPYLHPELAGSKNSRGSEGALAQR